MRGIVALAGPGADPVDDVRQMLALHFMVNAFRAGAVVAVLGAVIGWYMVLRRQSFVGHTLAVVSFPGAAAALWLGVSVTAGYFAGSIAAALVIALVPRSPAGRAGSQESAVIGTVQAFALATGALFVSLYGGFLDSVTGLLFGSFLGVSDGQVVALVVVAVVVLASWPSWVAPSSSPPSTGTSPWPAGSPSGRCRWRSCWCSAARPPRSARSPAPCWSSPCWSCRPPPPSS